MVKFTKMIFRELLIVRRSILELLIKTSDFVPQLNYLRAIKI